MEPEALAAATRPRETGRASRGRQATRSSEVGPSQAPALLGRGGETKACLPRFELLSSGFVLWICPGSLSQRQSPRSGLAFSWPQASEHPTPLPCNLLCRLAAPGWVLPTCSPDSPAQPLLPRAFVLIRLCLWAPASPPTWHREEGLSHAPRSSPRPSGEQGWPAPIFSIPNVMSVSA